MLLLSARVTAEAIPVGLDARIALWRDRMADRKVLLLLDDATGPEQVYPLLPESDRSLVLITSLLRLVALDDAVFISLDILSRQDAAGLFVRLASWPDLQPTDPAVAEIVHLCGYLPLAIRVIAGRAATIQPGVSATWSSTLPQRRVASRCCGQGTSPWQRPSTSPTRD
jgi:hypothetical protein